MKRLIVPFLLLATLFGYSEIVDTRTEAYRDTQTQAFFEGVKTGAKSMELSRLLGYGELGFRAASNYVMLEWRAYLAKLPPPYPEGWGTNVWGGNIVTNIYPRGHTNDGPRSHRSHFPVIAPFEEQ